MKSIQTNSIILAVTIQTILSVQKIVELNNGKRVIPTIIVEDTVLSNPDNQKLKEYLNIN